MKIHKTEAKNLHTGFLSIDSLTITHDTFDGQSLTVDREILERGNAVAVLAYDPALDKVLLIRQMLPGVVAHILSKVTALCRLLVVPQSVFRPILRLPTFHRQATSSVLLVKMKILRQKSWTHRELLIFSIKV